MDFMQLRRAHPNIFFSPQAMKWFVEHAFQALAAGLS